MAKQGSVEYVAKTLLSPHEHLSPIFFGQDDVMREGIRQRLLEFVQIYLDNIYSKFENTYIRDICLVGSQASYFYHDRSDIDIVIDIQSKNAAYIPHDYKPFHKFLSYAEHPFLPHKNHQTFRGISIDVKPFMQEYKFEQQYSILHNKWVVKFDKKILEGITVEDLVRSYYKELASINQTMKNIYKEGDVNSKETADKVLDYFNYLVYEMRNESFIANNVYRILRSQKVIQEMAQQIALNDLRRINRTVRP